MKNFKTILLAVLTILATTTLFTSCSGSSPEAIAEKYFEASLVGDIETMKEFASETQALTLVDKMTEDYKNNPEKKEIMDEFAKSERTYQEAIIDPNDPNKATVMVILSDPEGKEDSTDLNIRLINEEGNWKVDEIDFK